MKLNISYPPTGCQKCIDIDDERKFRIFYDKRISQEVEADALGDQFKGYIFKIAGGNDKQGFPMKQGVLTNTRVRLLMGKNTTCYRPRRSGERKRKSVRGCIVGADISALHLVIVKKGPEELPDLTDKYVPRRLGPKRASKIRKLFNLSKQDDVRKYVIRREILPKEPKEGEEAKAKKTIKKKSKAPKIQRLVTPRVLQHKRHRLALKKKRFDRNKIEAADYAKLVAQRNKERRDKRKQTLSKRRSTSTKQDVAPAATPAKTAAPAKTETKAAAPAKAETKTPAKAVAPAKTETKAPAKTETKAPAKTETKAPAKTETKAAAPAKAETKAPAKTTAPAKTETKAAAPAKAETKAPAKTQSKGKNN